MRTGPVIGAYIGYQQDISWRWTEWITLILIGVTFTLILLFKRESFAPRLLHYKAQHFRKLTGNNRFLTATEASHGSIGELLSRSFLRPFLLSTQPIVMAFTLYLMIVYIILFTFLDGYVNLERYGKADVAHITNSLTAILTSSRKLSISTRGCLTSVSLDCLLA
jgi:MFS family permease